MAFARLPLNALRVFEAFARTGSMAGAAEALNVMPSAVSMQLKALQDHVGVPLLRKAGRGAELTPAGRALAGEIGAALAQIEQALRGLRSKSRREAVHLTVLPNFVTSWLLPRLPRLQAECPDVELALNSSGRVEPLGRQGPQAAVRLGPGRWPGTRADKLCDEWLLPVCSPAVRSRDGEVEPAIWPQRHTLIHNRVDPWTLWAEPPPRAPRERVVLDDTLACAMAAEAGLGLALARATVVADRLARGSLVAAGPRLPYRYGFYFVTPRGVPDTPPLATLRAWFKREMKAV